MKPYVGLFLIAALCFAGGIYFQNFKKEKEEEAAAAEARKREQTAQAEKKTKQESKPVVDKVIETVVQTVTPPPPEPEPEDEDKIDINMNVMVGLSSGTYTQPGIIGKIKGVLFVIANKNILFSSEPFAIKTANKAELKYDAIFASKDENIMIVRLANPPADLPFLEVESTETSLKQGDKIITIEKDARTGGCTAEIGLIRTAGSNKIEFDAYLNEETSGIPIIRFKQNKLIAWSIGIPKEDDFHVKKYDEVFYPDWDGRLLAERIDAIKEWDSIDLSLLRRQLQTFKEVNNKIYAMHALTQNNEEEYNKSTEIKSIIASGLARANSNAVQKEVDADMNTMKNKLIAEANGYTTNVINQGRSAYGMLKPYYTQLEEYSKRVQKEISQTRFEVSIYGRGSNRTVTLQIYQ